jgi:hypothetical protein
LKQPLSQLQCGAASEWLLLQATADMSGWSCTRIVCALPAAEQLSSQQVLQLLQAAVDLGDVTFVICRSKAAVQHYHVTAGGNSRIYYMFALRCVACLLLDAWHVNGGPSSVLLDHII